MEWKITVSVRLEAAIDVLTGAKNAAESDQAVRRQIVIALDAMYTALELLAIDDEEEGEGEPQAKAG